METEQFLIIGRGGIRGIRRTKPQLRWDEIAFKISLNIPDALFDRPHLEATIRVDEKDVQSNQINPEIIIHTKKLIEEQTGAKISFKVIPPNED